ncbi:MAG: hypothetical protein QM791_20315 [Ferruginibacter sp.]
MDQQKTAVIKQGNGETGQRSGGKLLTESQNHSERDFVLPNDNQFEK